MDSEERMHIHEELEELIRDNEQECEEVLETHYQLNGVEDDNHCSGESKATKAAKKRKRRNKKKRQTDNTEAVANGVGKEKIALPVTPLKYKLGASFYEDSDSSEDEGLADYKIGGYHPVHVGEVLIERYVIIQKLGWGHFSSVWLAKDMKYSTYVAMKIQRSAPHYLEAAFDEVEILDQASSFWRKPEWLESLKTYYKDNPEKLKHITGDDSYCVQLLNCFIHHGPHGKHFVMVFEILGVNLLEVIKRYNYKGTPLPVVRAMSDQCLMGLDYLHRVCKIIHTDLKPENVNLCLTEREVQEIAANGRLTTTKMYDQQEQLKRMEKAVTIDPTSVRGRRGDAMDESQKQNKQSKRAHKKKEQRRRKKQKLKQQREGTHQTEDDCLQEMDHDYETISPGLNKVKQESHKKFSLMKKNDSSTKPSPYNNGGSQKSLNNQNIEFSLRNLDSFQIKELNEVLQQYIDVPRSMSLPKCKTNYIPMGPSDDHVDLEILGLGELLEHCKQEYDISEYEKLKLHLEEFLFYRKKFEQSQRAIAHKTGGLPPVSKANGFGIPSLNLDVLDPRKMQQEIEEDKASKRGPRLDETIRIKICDLGNGCWSYHHFSTEIQTRQYRSPEVIIGAKYGTSADVWSFACMMFEIATGDFLFEPRKGKNFDKDDDHLAQMMELLGKMPKNMALSGKHYKKFFDRSGHLKRIRGLKYWPLKKVLTEKYRFRESEAQAFSDFLLPMLRWEPEKRASAQQMIGHYWLKMPSNYNSKMTDEEYQQYMERQRRTQPIVQDPFHNEEMSKLGETDTEYNCSDIEDNDRSFFSDLEEDGNPYFTSSEDEAINPKEYRDIAEGKNLNNSFVGPYPENWDHLHYDKGANAQFLVFSEAQKTNFLHLQAPQQRATLTQSQKSAR